MCDQDISKANDVRQDESSLIFARIGADSKQERWAEDGAEVVPKASWKDRGVTKQPRLKIYSTEELIERPTRGKKNRDWRLLVRLEMVGEIS